MNVPAASHKHVVIVGATGMVGGYALRYALENSAVGVERAEKLFGSLSPEQLEQELAPGKNRLIYLWAILRR
ncbi:MAG TPA: hypothetical protein VN881_11965 [Candidatus Acidoferrales bacterium]|jgi:hypothetical protein|nr:hypothetical protein [Candidatus Acidoferrales bacterium]